MDWVKKALEACEVDLEVARQRSVEADKKEAEAHQDAVEAQLKWDEFRQAKRALQAIMSDEPRHEVTL